MAIEWTLNCNSSVNNQGAHFFDYARYPLAPLDSSRLDSITEAIESHEELDETGITTKTSFEVLV
jgi:hypothetical protein